MKKVKVFATREFGKNGADLTKEEFVRMMIEDINAAKIEFRKHSDMLAEEDYQKDIQNRKTYLASRREQITEQSYKKYKREKNRLLWVEKEMAKITEKFPETIERNPHYHYGREMGSISWDIKPWENGSSLISVASDGQQIAIDDVIFANRFGSLYDEAIDNKYFRGATGWSFVGDYSAEMKLTLSDELQQEWADDKSKLAKAIADFYADCTYWGD